jgi:hypothetical protein
MNIDQIDSLRNLMEEIDLFLESLDHEDNEDGEYTFLEDESGISNTEVDNFIESLYTVREMAEKFTM